MGGGQLGGHDELTIKDRLRKWLIYKNFYFIIDKQIQNIE
tara:strand:+ start:555 stop:674 length:120 start_codon:yes stop_codon:yes gene_type:complete